VVRVLVQARNGDFYGTTYIGGSQSKGAVFKITPNGALTTSPGLQWEFVRNDHQRWGERQRHDFQNHHKRQVCCPVEIAIGALDRVAYVLPTTIPMSTVSRTAR
jgi:uncharacterized repeat protein (TIGR03803 family)